MQGNLVLLATTQPAAFNNPSSDDAFMSHVQHNIKGYDMHDKQESCRDSRYALVLVTHKARTRATVASPPPSPAVLLVQSNHESSNAAASSALEPCCTCHLEQVRSARLVYFTARTTNTVNNTSLVRFTCEVYNANSSAAALSALLTICTSHNSSTKSCSANNRLC